MFELEAKRASEIVATRELRESVGGNCGNSDHRDQGRIKSNEIDGGFEGWFNGDPELTAAFFAQRVLHAHNRATGTTTASNPLRGRRPMPKTKQVNGGILLCQGI